jgi:hypothetical protein
MVYEGDIHEGLVIDAGYINPGQSIEFKIVTNPPEGTEQTFFVTTTLVGSGWPMENYVFGSLYLNSVPYREWYFEAYYDIDSSSCLDLRPDTGPPREPQLHYTQSDTHLVYSSIPDWHDHPMDSIWFYSEIDSNRDSLYLDSTIAWMSGIFDLGTINNGSLFNFYLKSMVQSTFGEVMYPKIFYDDFFEEWDVSFENWIDNHFYDYSGNLYMATPRYKICFDHTSFAPGDTVRFTIDVLGTIDESWTDAEMDVNILQGRKYATIIDTLGNVYGQDISKIDPEYGRVFKPFSQINDELAIVISDATPAGTKLSIQAVSWLDDWNTGRAELEVYSCIKITLDPPSITPGDTAQIIVPKIMSDGSTVDFPPDQLFDVSIMQGSDYGTLLSADGTNIADALTGVPQGFKFVAENAIDVDSAVVLINVMKSSNTLTSKQTVNKTIQSVENTCAPGQVTIEKEECTESIVECSGLDLQPQTLSDDNIKIYENNESFYVNGLDVPYVVDGCSFHIWDAIEHHKTRYGVTFIIPGIPISDHGPFAWQPQDEINPTVCLDRSSGRWYFHIQNLQVPIFSSFCPNNLIDLGDGNNSSLLAANIPDDITYRQALDDLEWWKTGAYSNDDGSKPKKFVFSPIVLKHEEKHLSDNIEGTKKIYNDAFNEIFNDPFLLSNNPCPENVIDNSIVFLKIIIKNAQEKASDESWKVSGVIGKSQIEGGADRHAHDSGIDDNIKASLLAWRSTVNLQ